MSAMWPSETRDTYNDTLETYRSNLRQIIDSSIELSDVAQVIIGGDTELPDLETTVAELGKAWEDSDLPDVEPLLISLACAQALAISPTLQTWINVRKLKSNSTHLEHYLDSAMVVYAEAHEEAKSAYIELAKSAINAREQNQLQSQFERTNREREQLRTAWQELPDKLDEIWWGLRHASVEFHEEAPLFDVLASLDIDELVNALSDIENPYLINSIFWNIGVDRKFPHWEKLVTDLPVAFGENAAWHESPAVPLLLVIARDQLLEANRSSLAPDSSDEEKGRVRQELGILARKIVSTLAVRQDAAPLFTRWSNWLIRQELLREERDAQPSIFADELLIDAIGEQFKTNHYATFSELPADASAWEHWCHRAVNAWWASDGHVDMPDSYSFLKEWDMYIDEWLEDQGKVFGNRARFFVTTNKNMPGKAAHFLAYPIAESDNATDAWIGMWNDIHPLREIVEFEDYAPEKPITNKDASDYLLLAFKIGLAILDQKANQTSDCLSSQARGLTKLYQMLASATSEMQEIDISLNREQWMQATQHLAVRRLIWQNRKPDSVADTKPCVFLSDDSPTFAEYLEDAKNDALELLKIIQAALLNESDQNVIRDELQNTKIDLPSVIENAKELQRFSMRKYPIDEPMLKMLDDFAEDLTH